ncbi:oncostatin-M isoform X2 [Falco naumanni]|uniref:oncostatin-M isoform X2 n=1 Tax=Falco naumanni TaxID=148594 RepID=UPI001ADE8A3A|nr:oncostatin-M isoform X2 [Falco naumanni]
MDRWTYGQIANRLSRQVDGQTTSNRSAERRSLWFLHPSRTALGTALPTLAPPHPAQPSPLPEDTRRRKEEEEAVGGGSSAGPSVAAGSHLIWGKENISSSGTVTKGLFILWAVPSQGGRPLQPPTLQQIQALVRHMAEDAQELFTFYEKDQHLAINNLCRTKRPPEWLRGPVPGPRGLQRLRGTMTRMAQALQDITRHQRDLNPPDAEILRRLASTHLKKLEGCRILWSYARFMAKLNAQLEARSRRAQREKRRWQRGPWLPARS